MSCRSAIRNASNDTPNGQECQRLSSGNGMTAQFPDISSVMGRLYGAAIARFAHGLLVVSAPTSTDAHEGWDPAAESIHAGPDSLYISVQQAASGHVGVACVEGHSPSCRCGNKAELIKARLQW